MFTFDSARTMDAANGMHLGARYRTHDGRWVDSTGAFLVGELERLDPTLYMPLYSVKWSRDIDLRTDVTLGDEFTAFSQTKVASAGSLGTGHGVGNGKAWVGKETTQITGVDLDLNKLSLPLTLWALELKYTIPELESAIRLARPIDAQKVEVINMKHQQDIDEQVYIGDISLNQPGLLTSPKVQKVTATVKSAGGTTWAKATPDEILADFNLALTTAWGNTGWAVMPNRIGLPPQQYGFISTAKVATQAGNISIRRYIEENNLLTADGGPQLEIVDMKWAVGAGQGGVIGQPGTVDRLVVYAKDRNYVRFPMTQLDRTPLQYEGIYHKATYYCRLGVVEIPRPETILYMDGI